MNVRPGGLPSLPSSRILWAILLSVAGGASALTGCVHPDPLEEAVSWLEAEAHRLIRASARPMADGTTAFPPQVGPGYEAFWLRDFAYTLEGAAESYSDGELLDAARLFAGNLAQDGSGVDRVNFDGTPLYRPGGGGDLGENPVADGGPFTVSVAWHAWQRTRDRGFLEEVLPALERTMRAVPRNPETGLVWIRPGGHDRCPYGFTDTIRKQGDVLFTSLLYIEAGRRLSALLAAVDRPVEAAAWRAETDSVGLAVRSGLWNPSTGLFDAASVVCRQPDIWGSAFAVFLGVADSAQARAIASYFKTHHAELVHRGQIRHLPGGTYWEAALEGMERDRYQNGGYWGVATGWFVFTLDLVDPALADQTVVDLVADYRRHGASEWSFGEIRTLPDYLASAALPLAGIRAMRARRSMDRVASP